MESFPFLLSEILTTVSYDRVGTHETGPIGLNWTVVRMSLQ